MMHIRKRISGLVLALLAVAGSGAFTGYGHAAAVPAPRSGAPAFMSTAPLFASAGTIGTGAFVGADARSTSSAITVSIFGPGTIRTSSICYWDTSVVGGTPPYTYQWYGGSSSVRNQPDFYASSTHSFWLDVKVTDSLGAVGWGSEYITVSPNAGACPL